ncbi:hypothetical protein B879_04233 [Cecembia lonarensis LW9]|uniref:Uncharacterized protein n=1 Tax=Cecembia lonarensis (strain CCUG 58316 / KCTC 22772 / LW9) TaxID=1225176 RepID=K1LSU7_CECL9|nr:hypothetical protein B879_04233 [Cecembia lonarensis LW9]
MRALDLVAGTNVVDLVDLRRIRIALALLIHQQRILVPRSFPELVGDIQVFVGPVITGIVFDQGVEAEVACGIFLGAGDDVPCDAALGNVVEGGDLAGEVERMVLHDIGGVGQPDVLRGHGQGAEQHRGIVGRDLQPLVYVVHVLAVGRAVKARDIGEEHCVEQALFQGLGQFDPEVHVVELVLACLGVAPLAVVYVAGGVHQECVEKQRLAHVFVPFGALVPT